jgi:photosystem II stability/assembly factor-like uncharacterized protein
MNELTETPPSPAEREVKDLIARVARRGATVELSLDLTAVAQEPRRHRSKALYVPLAALMAIAAVVLAVLFLVVGPGTPPPGATSHSEGSSSLRMELVDSTSSPFQSVGGGPQTGDLLCPTTSTCYASQSGSGGLYWETTTDGGVTWHPLARLPEGRLLADPLSCPTPTTCVGDAEPTVGGGLAPSDQPEVAWTSDGGKQWRLHPLPVPAGDGHATLERLSCPTSSECVAFLTNSPTTNPSVFMITTDGGTTWKSSAAPTGLSGLWALRCDKDGSCIGLDPLGSVQAPNTEAIVAIRSSDLGATWTTSSSPMPAGPGILHMDCGDALHCMMAFGVDNGATFDIARTSDGGQSWTKVTAPAGWPSTAISLSCADGEDCYLSASDYARSGYVSAALKVTHDGGVSWTALRLPDVKGKPLALVYPLSCPVASGCIGVGATPQEFDISPRLSHPPHLTAPPSPNNKNRVIISNLLPSRNS